MKASGIYVTRDEIKKHLVELWRNRNYWQARFCAAAHDEHATEKSDEINPAKVTKARAIRAEQRARAIEDALALWGDIYVTPHTDWDSPRIPEDYHPVIALEIEWGSGETETVKISG